MDVDMQHGFILAVWTLKLKFQQVLGLAEWTWTWTFRMDLALDLQYLLGVAEWTWKFSKDSDMQHGHGHAALARKCSMDRYIHGACPSSCPCCMFASMLYVHV
jgi:hypothetical protein